MNIVIAVAAAATTRINKIFFLIVLVAGTFTALLPSFIIGEVQAQKTES